MYPLDTQKRTNVTAVFQRVKQELKSVSVLKQQKSCGHLFIFVIHWFCIFDAIQVLTKITGGLQTLSNLSWHPASQ